MTGSEFDAFAEVANAAMAAGEALDYLIAEYRDSADPAIRMQLYEVLHLLDESLVLLAHEVPPEDASPE